MKFLVLVVVPLVGARVVQTQQQIPIIGSPGNIDATIARPLSLGTTEEEVPTVGVQFTTSYAVASARYQNGTMRDLGKVVGDAAYVELMSQWAEAKDDVSCDYRNLSTCDELRPESNEGLEAGSSLNHDSAVLAAFLDRVRGAIEEELDQPVQRIAPVFPLLSPYSDVVVRDAFGKARLHSTNAHTVKPGYEEANAAYAALGHGLCEPSMNHTSCTEATKLRKRETVFYFNFDNSSFSVGATFMKTAFEISPMVSYRMNTKLGWWNLPVFEAPRARFLTQIHEMIMAVVASIGRPPNKIILLGEHGADEEFKEVVKAAVWEVLDFDVEFMLDVVPQADVGYLVARGAAELGYRDGRLGRQNEALPRS